MATKIIIFNPLSKPEVEKAESDVDGLLTAGYIISASVGGNQNASPGGPEPWFPGTQTLQNYVVLVLYQDVPLGVQRLS